MRTRALVLATTLTAAALAGAAALPAVAADKGPGAAPGVVGYVTADSRYSGSSVSGPVRKGPQGRFEVRLPGGTWLECGRSCAARPSISGAITAAATAAATAPATCSSGGEPPSLCLADHTTEAN